MARPNYVCTTCSEHFTRKYTAKRHNITIHHDNGAEIVPLVEYLVGRNSGKYEASHPSWYRRPSKETRIHKFGRAMVADTMGDSFPRRGLQQQTPFQSIGTTPQSPPGQLSPAYQPQPSDLGISPYRPDQLCQTIDTTNDQGTLSQGTMLKIQELKRLIYRYPQYYSNPDAIIKCATYWSVNGDDKVLDDMLERFRLISNFMG